MNVEVTQCGVDEVLGHPGFPRLWQENAAECADQELSPAAPDAEFYRKLEAAGFAHCLRCGPGDELHGFALVLVNPSGHNGKHYAAVESLFVEMAARRYGAWSLMKTAIQYVARAAGCEAVVISAHPETRLARLLFACEGEYELTNYVFRKRLK